MTAERPSLSVTAYLVETDEPYINPPPDPLPAGPISGTKLRDFAWPYLTKVSEPYVINPEKVFIHGAYGIEVGLDVPLQPSGVEHLDYEMKEVEVWVEPASLVCPSTSALLFRSAPWNDAPKLYGSGNRILFYLYVQLNPVTRPAFQADPMAYDFVFEGKTNNGKYVAVDSIFAWQRTDENPEGGFDTTSDLIWRLPEHSDSYSVLYFDMPAAEAGLTGSVSLALSKDGLQTDSVTLTYHVDALPADWEVEFCTYVELSDVVGDFFGGVVDPSSELFVCS